MLMRFLEVVLLLAACVFVASGSKLHGSAHESTIAFSSRDTRVTDTSDSDQTSSSLANTVSISVSGEISSAKKNEFEFREASIATEMPPRPYFLQDNYGYQYTIGLVELSSKALIPGIQVEQNFQIKHFYLFENNDLTEVASHDAERHVIGFEPIGTNLSGGYSFYDNSGRLLASGNAFVRNGHFYLDTSTDLHIVSTDDGRLVQFDRLHNEHGSKRQRIS